MEQEEIEIFKEFIFQNKGLIHKTTSYYGLNREELEQEYALAYFSDERIRELFCSGDKTGAFNVFQPILRRNMSSHSNSSIQKRGRYAYEREQQAERVAIAQLQAVEDSPEDGMVALCNIELLKEKIGSEVIDFMISYVSYGGEITGIKYGMTPTNTRKKFQRIKEECRKILGLK